MLYKSLRCESGKELYNLAAPILKTLYNDPETLRVRDIKPGDQVESIYDHVNNANTLFCYGPVESLREANDEGREIEEQEKFPRNLWYNDADKAEDAILFPEELVDVKADPLGIGKLGPLQNMERGGFSMKKWVDGDWDSESSSDKDWSDTESVLEGEFPQEEGRGRGSDADDVEGNDGDSDWEDEVEMIGGPPIFSSKWSSEMKQALKDIVNKRNAMSSESSPDRGNPAVMEREFFEFIDKEKSRGALYPYSKRSTNEQL